MNFRAYMQRGFLKKANADFSQIRKQLRRAQKDLETFEVLCEADPEWAATVAYQSILRAGRALIYAHGYLPADGRQHKTVVEITGSILGEEYAAPARHFERLRRKRNSFFYDSDDPGNVDEARSAARTASGLLREIAQRVSGLDPQLGLNV